MDMLVSISTRADAGPLRTYVNALERVGPTAVQASASLGRLAVAGAALAGAALGIRSLGDAVVGFNGRLEQAQIAFSTMLGSGERAKTFLLEMERFAARTPFAFPELLDASRRLLAFGFSAQQVMPLLTDVGNAVSAMGGGAVMIDRVTIALGQMQTRQRVSANEMLQLTEAGIPAWDILAKAIGRTTQETIKLTEKGEVASSVFIKAFMEHSRANFGDLMARQARTFSGAMETIRDSLVSGAATAFRPFFDRLRDLAVNIADFVQSDQFREWAVRVSVHVEVVLRGLGILANGFQRALSAIARITLSAGTIILRALQALNPFARRSPSLVEQVDAGLATIVDRFQGLPGAVTPALRATGSAIADLRRQVAGAGGLDARGLDTLGDAIQRQERALQGAERALRPYDRLLDEHRRRVSALGDAYQQAQRDLDQFRNAPLQMERAFDDALFGLDQRQAALRLRQLQMQETGPGRGYLNRVRFAQERAGLEREMAGLGRQEERLRLERQLTVDPQRRALQQVGQSPALSFVEAMKGAQDAFNRVQQLGPAFAAAQAETERMAADLQAQRDALQEQRDALADVRADYAAIADAMQKAKGTGGMAFGPVELPGIQDALAGIGELGTGLDGLRDDLIKEMQPALDGFETGMNNLLKPLEDLADRLAAVADAGDTARTALTTFATEVGRVWDTVLRPPVERAITNFQTNLPAAIRTTEQQFASLKKAVTDAVDWWQDFEEAWGGGGGGNVFDQLSRSINAFGKSLHEPLMMVINFLDILLERAVEVGSVIADMVAGRGVRRPNFLDEQGRPRDPFAEAVERTRLRIGPSQQALEEIGGRQTTRMPRTPEYQPTPERIRHGAALERQHGGPAYAGRLYRVNETGVREYFVPSISGTVVPAGQSGGGRGGATITINLNHPVVRDDSDLRRLADLAATKVEEALAAAWNGADAEGTRPRVLLAPRGAY